MSYPPSLTTTHLTADFRRLSGGAALEAEVWIASPSALVSAGDDVIIPRANVAETTTGGLLDVELPVSDAAGWGPHGFQYLVRATFDTGIQMAWLVQLLTANGDEQDLADYGVEIPYPNSTGAFTVLYPSAPSGGGAGVTSFAGRVGPVVPANDDYSFSQLSGQAVTGDIQDGAVTTAKMAAVAASTVLGNAGGSAAAPQALTVAALRAMLETVVTLTDAPTILTDATAGRVFEVTLTAAGRSLGAPSNPARGMWRVWRFVQGGSGGYGITLNAVFDTDFIGGTPVLATAVGGVTYIGGFYTGTKWDVLAYGTEA